MPGPNFSLAAEGIVASYKMALRNSADNPVFLLGDFNNCEISAVLPNLEQYITCPTRLNKTLDKCFGNVDCAHVSRLHPQLGRSDHNVIHLLPKYRQMLKRTKPVIQPVWSWTKDSVANIRDCFQSTDWDLFFNDFNCCNRHELLNYTITGYIIFV